MDNIVKKYQVEWVDTSHNIKNTFDTYDSFDEAYKSIRDWWDLHNFEPPYVRIISHEDCYSIDYGSHTMFYHINIV